MFVCAIFAWVLVIVCISNCKKRKSYALSQVILLIPPDFWLSMEESHLFEEIHPFHGSVACDLCKYLCAMQTPTPIFKNRRRRRAI